VDKYRSLKYDTLLSAGYLLGLTEAEEEREMGRIDEQ
jgi:hypothetical protein